MPTLPGAQAREGGTQRAAEIQLPQGAEHLLPRDPSSPFCFSFCKTRWGEKNPAGLICALTDRQRPAPGPPGPPRSCPRGRERGGCASTACPPGRPAGLGGGNQAPQGREQSALQDRRGARGSGAGLEVGGAPGGRGSSGWGSGWAWLSVGGAPRGLQPWSPSNFKKSCKSVPLGDAGTASQAGSSAWGPRPTPPAILIFPRPRTHFIPPSAPLAPLNGAPPCPWGFHWPRLLRLWSQSPASPGGRPGSTPTGPAPRQGPSSGGGAVHRVLQMGERLGLKGDVWASGSSSLGEAELGEKALPSKPFLVEHSAPPAPPQIRLNRCCPHAAEPPKHPSVSPPACAPALGRAQTNPDLRGGEDNSGLGHSLPGPREARTGLGEGPKEQQSRA